MKPSELNFASLTVEDDAKAIWLREHPEYRECPASFIEFVMSPEYLGVGRDTYPMLIAYGHEIATKRVQEVIFLAGYGSGKSFLGQVLLCYQAHQLLCLKNPHEVFSLQRDKPISIMNMGLSAHQARNVVFAGMRSLMSGSPWFRRQKPEMLATRVTFKREGIPIVEMISGSSSENAPIGMNLFAGLIDEAAFMLDSENRNQAENIYTTIHNRIASRFGKYGMVIVISSPNHEKDFITEKYNEGLAHPERVFSISAPTWHVKDRRKLSRKVFVFDHERMRIVQPEQYLGYEVKSGEKVNIVIGEEEIERLGFQEDLLVKNLWVIPDDYYDAFERDGDRAARDLGAKASRSLEVFIKLEHMIQLACGKVRNPVENETGRWKLPPAPDTAVFVHIDLGLNRERKNGSGDACGFAVGHLVGHDPKNGGMAKVKIDLVEQIERDETGEVQISHVRARVSQLIEQGWGVLWVTMDGWQSEDSLQQFRSWGLEADKLSVDDDPKPYQDLKDSLYTRNVELPADDGNKHVKVLKRELRELEVVKGKKIDHPPKGSKDVSDAVAGVVSKIKEYYGVETEGGTYLIR